MDFPTPEPIPSLPLNNEPISDAKLKPWALAVFAVLFLVLLCAIVFMFLSTGPIDK